MRRVVKVVVGLVVVQAVLYAVGQVLKRRYSRIADPIDDEFDLFNIMDGTEFASHAYAFRGGSVHNYFGSVELDLRGARIAPGGATLEVITVCGSTEITVPTTWRVIVRGTAQAGAHEVDVTPEDDLDNDAPTFVIEAQTMLGGLEVKAARSVSATV